MAYRILMIDDDAELLKMLKKYFELKRYGRERVRGAGKNKAAAGYHFAGCKYAEH